MMLQLQRDQWYRDSLFLSSQHRFYIWSNHESSRRFVLAECLPTTERLSAFIGVAPYTGSSVTSSTVGIGALWFSWKSNIFWRICSILKIGLVRGLSSPTWRADTLRRPNKLGPNQQLSSWTWCFRSPIRCSTASNPNYFSQPRVTPFDQLLASQTSSSPSGRKQQIEKKFRARKPATTNQKPDYFHRPGRANLLLPSRLQFNWDIRIHTRARHFTLASKQADTSSRDLLPSSS